MSQKYIIILSRNKKLKYLLKLIYSSYKCEHIFPVSLSSEHIFPVNRTYMEKINFFLRILIIINKLL